MEGMLHRLGAFLTSELTVKIENNDFAIKIFAFPLRGMELLCFLASRMLKLIDN